MMQFNEKIMSLIGCAIGFSGMAYTYFINDEDDLSSFCMILETFWMPTIGYIAPRFLHGNLKDCCVGDDQVRDSNQFEITSDNNINYIGEV